MKKMIKVIEFNRNDKSQEYYCLPISENLAPKDLVKMATSLCKIIMKSKSVPHAIFDIPSDISFSKDFFINEATIIIYYGHWNMN